MEEIKVNIEPKILIQQILGNVLRSREGVTINVIMIGNTGDLYTGKRETLVSFKEKALPWYKRILPRKNLTEVQASSPLLLEKKQIRKGRGKYHISEEGLLKALEASDWNRAKAASILGIPIYTVGQKCRKLGLKRREKYNGKDTEIYYGVGITE